MKTRFDLEQDIMACWAVVDDTKAIYEFIGDDPFFKDMKPDHIDTLMNALLGMHSLYDIKFNKLFRTFEEVIRNGDLIQK